jgi:hypothetical protein
MIVEAFKETLELGLEKPKQVVVRPFFFCFSLPLSSTPTTTGEIVLPPNPPLPYPTLPLIRLMDGIYAAIGRPVWGDMTKRVHTR